MQTLTSNDINIIRVEQASDYLGSAHNTFWV